MTTPHPKIAEIVRADGRYACEAYDFVLAAIEYTARALGRVPAEGATEDDPANHVSGRELLFGIRDFALREFGLMARTVFRMWGINGTADFGAIVFNLIEARVISKTPGDDRRDFHDVYDLDKELVRDYRIRLDELG